MDVGTPNSLQQQAPKAQTSSCIKASQPSMAVSESLAHPIPARGFRVQGLVFMQGFPSAPYVVRAANT